MDSIWDNLMAGLMKVPGIRVSRIKYLQKAFSAPVSGTVNPLEYYGIDRCRLCVKKAIKWHRWEVTSTSALTGIPGGLTLAVSLPADLLNYYSQMLILAQKIAYTYGWPEIAAEQAIQLNSCKTVFQLLMGVMMGDESAARAARTISAGAIGQRVLTLTDILPEEEIEEMLKSVSSTAGKMLSKEAVSKGASKAAPILGAFASGAASLVTFSRMSDRLNTILFPSCNVTAAHYQAKPQLPQSPEEYSYECIALLVLINVAKEDGKFSNKERELIFECLDSGTLSEEEKNYLYKCLEIDGITGFDFRKLAQEKSFIEYLDRQLNYFCKALEIDRNSSEYLRKLWEYLKDA